MHYIPKTWYKSLFAYIKSKIMQHGLSCGIASSNVTFKERLDDLMQAGLLTYEKKPTVKDGKIIGGGTTLWVSLTPLGKKVAEKLAEIKEIMEE